MPPQPDPAAPQLWVRTGATPWGTRVREKCIAALLAGCALLSIVTTIGIIFVLLDGSVYSFTGGGAFFQRQGVSLVEFLTGTDWHPQAGRFGILPLVCGTFLVAGIAAFVGLPIGLASAVYLSEYATPKLRSILKPTLEILAGIPTIVYGYFALLFITPWLLKPLFMDLLGIDVETFNVLSGGIVVGIMIIPVVCSVSEDALRAVPRSLREAAYALGSTKFDVSAKVVVPAALSGIVASFLLAISRAIGETMAVVLAVGNSPHLGLDVLNSAQTMTAYIVNVSGGDVAIGTPQYESLYAVALMLFLMTLAMNMVSHFFTRRYREVYQ